MKVYFSILAVVTFLFTGCLSVFDRKGVYASKNPTFAFETQERISRSACGPVSLVNALGSSSPKWQQVLKGYESMKPLSRSVIRRHGSISSSDFPERRRWSPRRGITMDDLLLIANEMSAPHTLPRLNTQVYVSEMGQSRSMFRRMQWQLTRSLKRGFTPVVSFTRVVQRKSDGGVLKWEPVGGHLVAVTSYSVSGRGLAEIFYIDPIDGQQYSAKLLVSENSDFAPDYPILVEAPQCHSFQNKVRSREESHLVLPLLMGDF